MTATLDSGGLTRREMLSATFTATATFAGATAVGGLLLTPRDARAAAPAWTSVPDQVWTIGAPVYLDLKQYVNDPDGDPLAITLDQPLPAGLTLTDGVISGTPTVELASTEFVATADDGIIAPNAPTHLKIL